MASIFNVPFHVLRSAHSNTTPYLINGLTVDQNRYAANFEISSTVRCIINDSRLLGLDRNRSFVQPLPHKEHSLLHLQRQITSKYRVIRNDCRRFNNLSVCSRTDGSRNSQSFLLWCAVCCSYAFLRLERTSLRWRQWEGVLCDFISFDYRVDVCRITKGAHIEHL
jgi:hypothetical protein